MNCSKKENNARETILFKQMKLYYLNFNLINWLLSQIKFEYHSLLNEYSWLSIEQSQG